MLSGTSHCPHAAQTSQLILSRSFLTRAYPTMKKNNPYVPIMVREAMGIEPRVYARYEFGVEKVADLKGERCPSPHSEGCEQYLTGMRYRARRQGDRRQGFGSCKRRTIAGYLRIECTRLRCPSSMAGKRSAEYNTQRLMQCLRNPPLNLHLRDNKGSYPHVNEVGSQKEGRVGHVAVWYADYIYAPTSPNRY
jgi:hypothetical protein